MAVRKCPRECKFSCSCCRFMSQGIPGRSVLQKILKKQADNVFRAPSKSPSPTLNIDFKHEVEDLYWQRQQCFQPSAIQICAVKQCEHSEVRLESRLSDKTCAKQWKIRDSNWILVLKQSLFLIVQSTILSALDYGGIPDADAAATVTPDSCTRSLSHSPLWVVWKGCTDLDGISIPVSSSMRTCYLR